MIKIILILVVIYHNWFWFSRKKLLLLCMIMVKLKNWKQKKTLNKQSLMVLNSLRFIMAITLTIRKVTIWIFFTNVIDFSRKLVVSLLSYQSKLSAVAISDIYNLGMDRPSLKLGFVFLEMALWVVTSWMQVETNIRLAHSLYETVKFTANYLKCVSS